MVFGPPHIPSGFAALPPEEQRRILESGHAINQLVYQHIRALLISPPPQSEDGGALRVNSATCFVLNLHGRCYLVTADHVLQKLINRLEAEPDCLLHLENLQLSLGSRFVVRDKEADIAMLELSPDELKLAEFHPLSAIGGWPPPPMKEGAFVAVGGFPAVVRKQPSPTTFDFPSFLGTYRVTTVGECYFSCQWEREAFLNIGPGAPVPGTELGGMSGGPALLIDEIALPPVGVVSQFSSSFEILRIGYLGSPCLLDELMARI